MSVEFDEDYIMKNVLLRSFTSLFLPLSIISTTAAIAGPTKPKQDNLSTLTSGTNEQFFVSNWIYNYEGEMMRANRDLKLAQLIQNNSVAQVAYSELVGQLKNMVELQELSLDANAAGSTKELDPQNKIRKIVQTVAKSEGFSAQSVENAKVWTTFGTVNAYTFSPLSSRLNIVVYQDLLDMMTDAQMHSVLAHELGHIKMRHVLSGLITQAVLESTGQIIVKDPAERLNLLSAIRSGTASLLKEAIDFDGPMADHIVKGLTSVGQNVGIKLSQTVDSAQLAQAADLIAEAIGTKTNFVQALNASVDKPAVDPMKYKELKEAMVKVTRDQERTADRWAVLVRGPKEVASAMAVLAGGKNANADVIQKQAFNMVQRAKELGVNIESLDKQDHPTPVVRVAAALIFSQSSQYEIMSNPFKKAVDEYFKIQIYMKNQRNDGDKSAQEQIRMNSVAVEMQQLQGFSQKLSTQILSVVKDELSQKKSVENTEYLLRLLDKMNADFANFSSTEMGKYGLIRDIKTIADANATDPAWKAVSEYLVLRAPDAPISGVISKLDKLLVSSDSSAPAAVSCNNLLK
jgi:Zn-dependent protease with chaperone function